MDADEHRSSRALVELVDVEILVIPFAIVLALTLLVKRSVGALGVIPIAAVAVIFVLVPLAVRALDPGRRERWIAYLAVNLLITAAITIVVWFLRVAVLAVFS